MEKDLLMIHSQVTWGLPSPNYSQSLEENIDYLLFISAYSIQESMKWNPLQKVWREEL